MDSTVNCRLRHLVSYGALTYQHVTLVTDIKSDTRFRPYHFVPDRVANSIIPDRIPHFAGFVSYFDGINPPAQYQ